MSKSGSISVCIPVYNGSVHLTDALFSIINQDISDLEIVIRDDGSRDQSMEIAEAFARNHPNAQWNLARNSTNLGMVGNWNACLHAASGQYVKMMGQDDILLPGCLQKQSQALIHNPHASLCVSAADLYSATGRRLFTKRRKWEEGCHPSQAVVQDCVKKAYNPLGEPVTGLASRKAMLSGGGYNEDFKYWVDVDMWFQILQFGDVEIIREPLCGFRIHQGAASFSLQGDSYAEFLEIAARYAPSSAAAQRSLSQRVRAGLDSVARLAIYRVFG